MHPGAGSLGGNGYVLHAAAGGFALYICMC